MNNQQTEEIKSLSSVELVANLITPDGKGKTYKRQCLRELLRQHFKLGVEAGRGATRVALKLDE